MKINPVISTIWVIFLFFAPYAAQAQRTCAADLSGPSYSNQSIAYELHNFLGSYELRFQVFADRTQVLLLNPHFSSNALKMGSIVDLVILAIMGKAPTLDKTLSHQWLHLSGDAVKAKIPLVIQRLNEIPDANPLVAMSLLFTPGLPNLLAWKSDALQTNTFLFTGRFQNAWANFVCSLKTHELIYLNHMGGKFFWSNEFLPTENLDTLIKFVFNLEARGPEVLARLQQRWQRRLTLNFGPEETSPEAKDLLRRIFHWRAEAVVRPLTATVYELHEGKINPPMTFQSQLNTNLNSNEESTLFHRSPEDPDEPVDYDVPISQLNISESLKNKFRDHNIGFVFQIGRFSARDLWETISLTRQQFLELLPELIAHGVHLQIDPQWDRQNFQLLKHYPSLNLLMNF